MSIEVANESGIDVSESELISVARFVITQMDVNPAAELSMVLLDTAAMADLHMRWMDLPGPTDVMSFPMDELEPGGRPDTPEPGPALTIQASVGVGGRDGRYPVVFRHSIEHPRSILTDSKPPEMPLVIQIVGADGSETLVTVIPRS